MRMNLVLFISYAFVIIYNFYSSFNRICKINIASFSLARLNIKNVRYNKFIIIIINYYNTRI